MSIREEGQFWRTGVVCFLEGADGVVVLTKSIIIITQVKFKIVLLVYVFLR